MNLSFIFCDGLCDISAPPFKETASVFPKSPYGRTAYGGKYFIRLDLVNDSHKCVVLRYFNPVGAHFSGLIGEDPRGIPNNLMPLIAQVAQKDRSYISIFGTDYDTRDGTGERDFIHISDLAIGHLKAAEKINGLPKFQVINLGTGKSITVRELINLFEKTNNISVPSRTSKEDLGT